MCPSNIDSFVRGVIQDLEVRLKTQQTIYSILVYLLENVSMSNNILIANIGIICIVRDYNCG